MEKFWTNTLNLNGVLMAAVRGHLGQDCRSYQSDAGVKTNSRPGHLRLAPRVKVCKLDRQKHAVFSKYRLSIAAISFEENNYSDGIFFFFLPRIRSQFSSSNSN